MFTALVVGESEDEYSQTVGVSDGTADSVHYLMIQRSKILDDQDSALGMDKLYFEEDDQSKGFYAEVVRVVLLQDELEIWFKEYSQKKRAIPSMINCRLMLSMEDWERLRLGLLRIFTGHAEVQCFR